MAEPVCFLKIWKRQNGFWYHWCAVCLKQKTGMFLLVVLKVCYVAKMCSFV